MDYFLARLGVIISAGLTFQWFLARQYARVVVPATRDFLDNPRPVLQSALQEKARARKKNL